MITTVTTHDMAEHYLVVSKPCHKHPPKDSAYERAYGILAQKCRSAYERAYEPRPKCLRTCLHYYIGTIGITIVGTLNKLYKELERLCRPLWIVHFVFVCKGRRR